jgi:hypothetical protein
MEYRVVRYEGEVQSKVTQQLIEMFCLSLRPLPRSGFGGVRQPYCLTSLLGGEFGHLLDYVKQSLDHRDLTLSADALASR